MKVKLTQNVGIQYFIPVSEISFDAMGVVLHYRDYPAAINFISKDAAELARLRLKELFPDKYIDKYETRFKLGEFMDLVQNIKN